MTNEQLQHFTTRGWHLLGQYPNGMGRDVGSWILCHSGEALLLEIPPMLGTPRIEKELIELGNPYLKYITASHGHRDHLYPRVWDTISRYYRPTVISIDPASVIGEERFYLGGEILWLLKTPKHSRYDVVTIFRGIAHIGDIELGTLESNTQEVPRKLRERSMSRLATFPQRHNYHIHTVVSSRLDYIGVDIDWSSLFNYEV